MESILHLNYANENDVVYCEMRRDIVVFNDTFMQKRCANCLYFHGTMQSGEGVECIYEDSLAPVGEKTITVIEPHEFMSRRLKALASEDERRNKAFVVIDRDGK